MAFIFVIDDSKFTRFRIIESLKEYGHKFLEAENGQEALDLLENNTPDCILCDLLMPVIDLPP